MTRKDFAYQRQQRIFLIQKKLNDKLVKETFYPYAKFVAEMSIETGVTKTKVVEYIDLMIDAKVFKIIDDSLVLWYELEPVAVIDDKKLEAWR